jgi:hypothetical protein
MATTTIQSGSPIASFGDSYMPSLSDAADIQTALKALYFGSTGAANTSNGIYGALYTLYTGSPTIGGVGGTVTIAGNLTVNGTTTTINSSILNVDDILIELGAVASPTDTTANGGGIKVLDAGTGKLFTWSSTGANWTSTENLSLATGKTFKINNTTVLSSSQVFGRTPAGTSAGDIVTIDATQTLTNKTLTSPVISSIVNSGTLTLPTSTDQLVGRITTDTLANKTLTTPIIASISNSGTLTVPTGGGTIATTANIDTAINTFQKIQFFGDGSDGDVTISTQVTLARDMFYNNLTLGAGGRLFTRGLRVFVAGTLDVTAAQANYITHNATYNSAAFGSNASFATAGAAGGSNEEGPLQGSSGTVGGTGVSSPIAGFAGGSIANTTNVFPVAAYSGGTGGAGTSGTGGAGAGGTQTSPTITFGARRAWVDWTPLAAGKLLTSAGGTGGGSGGGFSGGISGGGGGGGASPNGIAIYANVINRGSGTGTAFINMVGGAGGNGAAASGAAGAGHGGGGAGGQGGFIYIVYGTLTGTSKAGAIKTTGGTGGNGAATATGGAGGSSGAVLLVNLSAGTTSYSAVVAGTTPSSGTPTGGTAGTLSVAL